MTDRNKEFIVGVGKSMPEDCIKDLLLALPTAFGRAVKKTDSSKEGPRYIYYAVHFTNTNHCSTNVCAPPHNDSEVLT